jgi:predicted nucleic acid-binding protein
MTLYVVDATVVAEYILTGPNTHNARAFFLGALTGDVFTVPELCLNECTNVIWKAVQFRGMPQAQANQALQNLKKLPLKRAPTKAILDVALEIGLKHHLAVYDALYIALALRSKNPFVTLDAKQERAAHAEGVLVTPMSRFT